MEADAGVKESLAYQIYKDGSDTINDYLYAHVDGVSRKVEEDNVASYFQHDTYMGITTYNHLRRMAGYSAVTLSTDHYLFQCNRRVKPLLLRLAKRGKIGCGGESLAYQQTLTDEFMQSELNGADYLVVVPDRTLAHMTPYYSVLAAKLKGKGSAALEDKLGRMQSYNNTEEDEYDFSMVVGYGSDQVFGNSGAVFVKDATVSDFTFAMGALMFFLAYVGIVFLVAALTILAVQQLADSGKYKFRYDILRKLGVGHRGMHRVVGRQLGLYYLCPFAISVLLTFAIGMFASERFVYYTDIQAGIFGYYAAALALFAFLYLIYVCVTYVSFVRNVEHPRV